MKYFSPKKFIKLWLLLTLAAPALFSCVSAQPVTEPPQRWLFIFDTSAAMKPRLPAIQTELQNIFLSAISGQLAPDATIGVWTFNQKINAGEFPLITWKPQFAAAVSSNIVRFLKDQHYTGKTMFAALNPALGRVIDNSERLTIILFCDGEDSLKLTPYDDGINQTFKQAKAEREKSKQPFVLVIRTQRGEFVGSTINFPPGILDLPIFPPLPVPPAVQTTAPTNSPPATVVTSVPVISLPPLVIVGTNVGTNIDDLPKVVPPLPRAAVTNSPPTVVATNAVGPNSDKIVATVSSNRPVTEDIKPTPAPVVTSPPTSAMPTNSIATTSSGSDNNGDNGTRNLILIGIGLLVAAIVLVFFLVLQRPRTARESLITSSIQNDPRPPAKK